MKEIMKLGAILLIICAVAASVLGFTNSITKPVIDEKMVIASNEARQAILTSAEKFEKVEGDFGPEYLEVYKGLKGSEVVGYTIKTAPKGYAGAVEVITGIDMEGKLVGVGIGEQHETPGLGTKAKDAAFNGQYKDKKVDSINVIKSGTPKDNEIVAIAGATITSKGVTQGVNDSIKLFNEKLK